MLQSAWSVYWACATSVVCRSMGMEMQCAALGTEFIATVWARSQTGDRNFAPLAFSESLHTHREFILVFVLPQKTIRKRVFHHREFSRFLSTSSEQVAVRVLFYVLQHNKILYFVQFMPFVAPLEEPVFVELTCTSTLQISIIPTKSRFVTHFLS